MKHIFQDFLFYIIWYFTSFTCVCLSLHAHQDEFDYLHTVGLVSPQNYAYRVASEKCVEHILEDIFAFCTEMKYNGYEIPNLKGFLEDCRLEAMSMGVKIDDELFEWLREEFEAYDNRDLSPTYEITRHKSKKHKKEVEISEKTAMGFIKFLTGSLMCIIPVHIIQTAGVALAVIGVDQMADASEEDGKKNAQERLDANRRIFTILA